MLKLELVNNKIIGKLTDETVNKLIDKICKIYEIKRDEWEKINILEKDRILTNNIKLLVLTNIIRSLTIEPNKKYIVELKFGNKLLYFSLVNLEPEKDDKKIKLPYGYAIDKITTLEAKILTKSKEV